MTGQALTTKAQTMTKAELQKLIEFIMSPKNEHLSDGEVLDYIIDELKKLTNNG
jgi:hypothetical protein